uniref:Uncharacterized protein n=1 Tax=Steinernema glaseri TaxID=37863 RepID=A0A1I7Z3E9_9BILA
MSSEKRSKIINQDKAPERTEITASDRVKKAPTSPEAPDGCHAALRLRPQPAQSRVGPTISGPRRRLPDL